MLAGINYSVNFLGVNFLEKILERDVPEFFHEVVFIVLNCLYRLSLTFGDIPEEIFSSIGIVWRAFPCRGGDFSQEKFYMGEFFKGEILHGGIFRRRNSLWGYFLWER